MGVFLNLFLFVTVFVPCVFGQEAAACYGAGSVAGAAIGAFIAALLLVAAAYYLRKLYWKSRKAAEPESIKIFQTNKSMAQVFEEYLKLKGQNSGQRTVADVFEEYVNRNSPWKITVEEALSEDHIVQVNSGKDKTVAEVLDEYLKNNDNWQKTIGDVLQGHLMGWNGNKNVPKTDVKKTVTELFEEYLKTKNNPSTDQKTVAQVFEEHLKTKSSTNNKSVAEVYQEYLQKNAVKTPLSPLRNFFITMANTVEGFPVPIQARIKRQVFEAISDTELSLIEGDKVNQLTSGAGTSSEIILQEDHVVYARKGQP